MKGRIMAILALSLESCRDESEIGSNMVALETPSHVAFDEITIVDGRGRYVAKRDRDVTEITFALPVTRLAPTIFHTGERLGETSDGAVVMIDEYASRPDGNRCTDGTEAFVRIFSLPARRELLSIPVESCLESIAGSDPRAQWLGNGRFRVNGPKERTYQINDATNVTMIEGGD